MRRSVYLALIAAVLLLVPVRALGAERLSPMVAQGLDSLARAKAVYTTPTIAAWPTASAITYGQSLAASTLTGGTTDVTGTFAFTDPTIVPAVGTYTAGVTFTPLDTANYTKVTGTVAVTVNEVPPPGEYTWSDYLGIPLLVLLALGIVRLAEWDRVGGPCFIATAAWGTPLAPEVDRLRGFRDNTLLAGALGTAAVDVYYRVSPGLADAVAASPALAMVVRMALIPVLVLVSLPTPLLAGLAVLTVALVLRRIARRRKEKRQTAE
jgi:hypothetical protein